MNIEYAKWALAVSVALHCALLAIGSPPFIPSSKPESPLDVRIAASLPRPEPASRPRNAAPVPRPAVVAAQAKMATPKEAPSDRAAAPAAIAAPPAASPAPPAKGREGGGAGHEEVVYSGAAYLDHPAPEYPAYARRVGYEGEVELMVRVSAKGNPLEIRVSRSSGHDILDRSAVKAVQSWKFVPAHAGAEAVESMVLIPLSFRLSE